MTNCPNCGAPLISHKCEYCGAVIFDFAAIEIGKPVWINLKASGRFVLAHVIPESVNVHIEPAMQSIIYADNKTQDIVSSYAPPRITMEFVEVPTSRGHYHIISKREAVSSTELNMDLEV